MLFFGLKTCSEPCSGVSVADFEHIDTSLHYIAKALKIFLYIEVA